MHFEMRTNFEDQKPAVHHNSPPSQQRGQNQMGERMDASWGSIWSQANKQTNMNMCTLDTNVQKYWQYGA
jgi:hypothetical protein